MPTVFHMFWRASVMLMSRGSGTVRRVKVGVPFCALYCVDQGLGPRRVVGRVAGVGVVRGALEEEAVDLRPVAGVEQLDDLGLVGGHGDGSPQQEVVGRRR